MSALMLLMLPLAELVLATFLARHFGWPWMLLALLAGAVLGSLLIRLRGAPYFRQAMAAMSRQEAPTGALLNGLAWYVAGVLLMIPGFITDVLAVLVLLPPVRRAMVSRLQKLTEGRLVNLQTVFTSRYGPTGSAGAGGMSGAGAEWPPRQGQGSGVVFEGEAREIVVKAPVLEESPRPEAPAERRIDP